MNLSRLAAACSARSPGARSCHFAVPAAQGRRHGSAGRRCNKKPTGCRTGLAVGLLSPLALAAKPRPPRAAASLRRPRAASAGEAQLRGAARLGALPPLIDSRTSIMQMAPGARRGAARGGEGRGPGALGGNTLRAPRPPPAPRTAPRPAWRKAIVAGLGTSLHVKSSRARF